MGIFSFRRGGDKKKKADKAEAQKLPLPKQPVDQKTLDEEESLNAQISQANYGNSPISISSGPLRPGASLQGTEWTEPPKLSVLGSAFGNASLSRLDLPSQPWAFCDEAARPRTSHGPDTEAQKLMDDTFVTGSVSLRPSSSRGPRSQPGGSPYDAQSSIARSPEIPVSPRAPLAPMAPNQSVPNPLGMHNAQSSSDNSLSAASSSTADTSGLFDLSSPSSNDHNESPESVSSIASPSEKAARRDGDAVSPLAAKSAPAIATLDSIVDSHASEVPKPRMREPKSDDMRLQSAATTVRPPPDVRARNIARRKDLSIKVPRRKSWSTEINMLEKSWLEEQLSPQSDKAKAQRPEQYQQGPDNAEAYNRGRFPRQVRHAQNTGERARSLGRAGGASFMPRTDSMPLPPPLPRESSRTAMNGFSAYGNQHPPGLRSSSPRTNFARGGPSQNPHNPHFQHDPKTLNPSWGNPRGTPAMPRPHYQGRLPMGGQYPSHLNAADPRSLPRHQNPRTKMPPLPLQNPMGYRDRPSQHNSSNQSASGMRSPTSPVSPHSPRGPYDSRNLRNAYSSQGSLSQGPHPYAPPRHPYGRHPNDSPAPQANYPMDATGHRPVPDMTDRKHPSATSPGHINTSLHGPVDPSRLGYGTATIPVQTVQAGQATQAGTAPYQHGLSVTSAESPPPLPQAQMKPQTSGKTTSQLPLSPDGDGACSLPPVDLPPTPISGKSSPENPMEVADDTPSSPSALHPQPESADATEGTSRDTTPRQIAVDTATETGDCVSRGAFTFRYGNDEQMQLSSQSSQSVEKVDIESAVEEKPGPKPESELESEAESGLEAAAESALDVELEEAFPETQLETQIEAEPKMGREGELKAEHDEGSRVETETKVETEPVKELHSGHEAVVEGHELVCGTETKTEPETQLKPPLQLAHLSLPSPTANWPLPSPSTQVEAETSTTKFSRPATPMALTPVKSTFTSSSSASYMIGEEEDDLSSLNSEREPSPLGAKAFTASVYAREIGVGPYAFDNNVNSTALSAYDLETAGSTPWLPSLRQDTSDFFTHAVAAKPAIICTPDMSVTDGSSWGAETLEGALSPESIGLARGLSIYGSATSPRGMVRKEARQPVDSGSQGGYGTGADLGIRTANIGVAIGRPGPGQVGQNTGMVDNFGTGFI